MQNHPLSSARYGLISKFIARFTGKYVVTGKLLDNVYFLRDLFDHGASTIATNVRQMALLHKASVPVVESEANSDEEPSNMGLLCRREKEYGRASLCTPGTMGTS